jgi:hypothetical protein
MSDRAVRRTHIMDEDDDNQRGPRPSRRGGRAVLGLVLAVLSCVWPVLEIGPNGPTLVSFSSTHGLDARDLLSLPLLLAAFVVVWPLRPRRRVAVHSESR